MLRAFKILIIVERAKFLKAKINAQKFEKAKKIIMHV